MKDFLVLLPLAVLALAGCSKTVTWKEEVQLSDGRVIVVERETFYTPGGDEWAHGGSGYHPEKYTLRVEYPVESGHYIEWLSTKKSPSRFNPESPLVLEIEGDTVAVYSTVAQSDVCWAYSKYANKNGQWAEEVLPDEFPQQPANLYQKGGMDMPSYIDLAMKVKENSNSRLPKFFRLIGPKRTICGL